MNCWRLGLATGIFPFRALQTPSLSAGDELDLMSVDGTAVVGNRNRDRGHAERLSPANRPAELRLQHGGARAWVRVAAVEDLTVWLEFLPLASTTVADREWTFVVHDYVLDDLVRVRGVSGDRSLHWLTERFVDATGGVARVVLQAGPTGLSPDAFTLVGEGFTLDVKRTPTGSIAHRLSRSRKVSGGLHGVEVPVTFLTRFDVPDPTLQASAPGLFPGSAESSLHEAYQRWLNIEIGLLARTSVELPLLPVEVAGDGSQTLRLVDLASDEATGNAKTGNEDRLGVGPRTNVERAQQTLRSALAAGSTPEEILTALQGLRAVLESYRLDSARGVLEPLGRPGRIGAAVAMALDVGSLQQIVRRQKALHRAVTTGNVVPILTLATGLSSQRPSPRPIRLSPSILSEAFRGQPTNSQREALEVALKTPDVAVIQGPPGTGKTRLLTALRMHLAAEQHSRGGAPIVLLTGPQHDAVDNLAIAGTGERRMPAARLGARRTEENAEHGHDPYGDQATKVWATRLAERLETSAGASSLSTALRRLRFIEGAVTVGGSRALKTYRREMLELARDNSDQTAYRALASALGNDGEPSRPGNATDLIQRIRCDRVSFHDDGAFVLRRLLAEQDLSSDLEALKARQLFEDLSDDNATPTVDQLRVLTQVKNDLIERQGATSTLGLPKDLLPALAAVVTSVDAKARDSVTAVGDAIAEFREHLLHEPGAVRDAVRHYADAFALTCGFAGSEQVNEEFAQSGLAEFDETSHVGVETVIIDEAARANPLDVLVAAQRARKRVVLVGDQKQLPALLEPESLDQLSPDDRASVSTPLFETLFDSLTDLRRQDGVDRVATLTEQFRMHPRIGSFVSRAFYQPAGITLTSARSDDEFVARVEPFGRSVAAWKDVPAASGADVRLGTGSRWRRAEVDATAWTVRRLREANPELSIGVIAFYSAQSRRLQDELGWPDQSQTPEEFWVGTVDGSQGREFDVVVISTVRSARRPGTNDISSFGHLVNPNRLNVALSRARRLLVVVGDREYLTGSPARSVQHLVDFGHLADDEASRG